MSDELENAIRVRIPDASWWWIASTYIHGVAFAPAPYHITAHGMDRHGYLVHISHETLPLGVLAGDLVFAQQGTDTIVYALPALYEHISYFQQVLNQMALVANEANDMRREYVGLTMDEAIERYYRQRAAGGKATLKQIAEKHGISYTALRKHKQQYDASGKWGSRKEIVMNHHKE